MVGDRVVLLVGVEGRTIKETSEQLRPWLASMREEWERRRDRGADGVVLTARSEADVVQLLDAAERW